jgi:hypothetical protein
MNHLGARIAGTVVAFLGWLAFIVLYLAFYGGNFTFWQSLAVFIASGAIVIAVIAVMWIWWALKQNRQSFGIAAALAWTAEK